MSAIGIGQILQGRLIQATAWTALGAALTASLPAKKGQRVSIIGFDVTLGVATAAATVMVTVTGVTTEDGSNQLNFALSASTTNQGGAAIRFPEPIPAASDDGAIQVQVPAVGGGAAQNAVNVYGARG